MNRIARLIATAAVAIGAIAGSVVTADSAHAATSVRFCFKYANPPAFSVYASKPVYLYYRAPGATSWTYLRSGTSDGLGCGTFYNTPSNMQLAARAYTSTQFMTWDGWSQYYAPTGAGQVNLGTGLAYRTA